MENNEPDFKILGQEFNYPNTWQGAVAISVSAIALCIALAIIYVWADNKGRQHVENIISQFRYNADGSFSSAANVGQIQFWTPSPNTYSDVKIEELPKNRSWQKKGAKKAKVDQFIDQLGAFSSGWRRNEVYGTGKTGPKLGYWWVVTINERFEMKEFVLFYSSFWGSNSTLYIETPVLQSKYQKPMS